MPSSVRDLSQTIGFLAFGFSEKPASGSSFGNSTMPVSSEAIFIAPSLCRKAPQGLGREGKAEAGLGGQDHVALHHRRRLIEQFQHPRHVLDGEAVRDR